MSERSCLAVILAAGESTRMRSDKSKVLHPVAGRPMIAHVMASVAGSGVREAALVVGRDAPAVAAAALTPGLEIETFFQAERLGTGHAVLAARVAIERGHDDILVTFGDVPLITEGPFRAARAALAEGNDVAVIGFETDRPTGYGRLIMENGELLAIREEKDATDEERRIRLCNSGLMAIDGRHALDLLTRIGNANAKGEYYLTDIVEIARARGGRATVVPASETELLGCNTRLELAQIERLWQDRRRRDLMISGVSMIAPETVFLSHDSEIARDVVLEPNIVFGPGVSIEKGAVIRAFSRLEGVTVASGAVFGPAA